MLRTFLGALLLLLGSIQTSATVYTVTSTADAGAGSLRAAITSANGAAGADTIRFNISGTGVKTITLASALPTITGQLFIDGYTQTGASWNGIDPGSNAVLRIELNGNNSVGTGLTVNASNCTIQGLILNRFTTNSINVQNGISGTRIIGNFIGTNAAGTASSGTGNGVVIAGNNSSIGDWGAENRNLFSGATGSTAALRFTGAGANSNYVRSNQFGLSADGTTVIGGFPQGVRFESSANWNQLGETGCCYNRITGATGAGIAMVGATTQSNNISGNAIWDNGGLGIDLNNDGVTANDVGDGDSGPNGLQNYPVIQAAMTDNETCVYVRLAFSGLANTWYGFHFYANASPDASGYGEGQLWIGTRYAQTDGSGNLLLHATAGAWNAIAPGTRISCVAVQDGNWNTSEFSQNVACVLGRPTVTNTSDVVNGNTASMIDLVGSPGADGISLREAIMAANNNLDAWTANHIFFDLPGAGAQTITPTSPLPALQTSTLIDGWSDPDFSGTPVVRINGSSAGAGANGITIDYPWCTLNALCITGFNGDGVRLNSSNNSIMGCHIGVTPNGMACAGNGGVGVRINNTEANSMGNPWYGDQPSVVSGNAGGGVLITGASARYNSIRHTYFGTNLTGTAALCTQPFGVILENGARDNTIGTDQLPKRNLMGGHTFDGINLDNANENILINNYVGTNLAGTAAIANTRAGIYVADSDGNDIGMSGQGNLVSGNTEDAIFLHTNSSNNTIIANTVGLASDGLTTLTNGAEGISLVSGASNNVVGGASAGERNLIAGNTGWGIHIGGGAQGNTVRGNYIGLNSAGIARPNQNGIVIENGQNNTVGPDNVISANTYHGVYVMESTSTGNVISGNRIGTNTAATAALPNGESGVLLRDGSNNTVGGSSAAVGNVIAGNGGHGVYVLGLSPTANANTIRFNRIGTNVNGNGALPNTHGIYITGIVTNTSIADNQISGNTGHGIVLDGAQVSGTTVRGNLIGTNASGSGAIANTQHGIWIGNSAHDNTIGGNTATDRNVIGGNGESGVNLQDLASNNTIKGNYIGITSNGASDLGNTHRGIHLRTGTTNTVIGGTGAGDGNVISGNDIHGIALEGSTTASILGNLIGTNAAGTARIGNNSAGIFLQTNGVTIGGNTPAHRNVISGNNAYGIYIETSFGQGSNNTIIGNYIGTDITGAVDLGNTFNGILMGGSGNRVGGSAAGEGNVISGNDDIGLRLESATNTMVLGNTIGLNAAGTTALGNLVGISLKFASNNNTVGGTTAAARNIISGNGGAGLIIDGSNTNAVQGNYIGTNSAGTLDRGNGSDGIRVLSAASTNTIGGTAAGTGNVISGNGNHGILLNGSAATTVRGNIIGLRAAGDAALGNDHDGIAIIASNNNIIGGSATGAGNTISGNVNSGNSADGIYVDSGSGNTIQGNRIGTDITGAVAFGNYYAGISNIANGTIIGGTNAGEGNIIRNNGTFGVRNQGTGVRILGNAIDANGGIGIDHNSDGVSPNDAGDVDGGPNSRQNFPVITSATSSGGNSTITGTLNSNASSTYRIEFFSSPTADPTGYGEGATFLGAVQPIATDASGNATINATLTGVTIPAGHYVTATATNLATNNTSEFSGALLAGFSISGTVFEDVNYGGGAGRDRSAALADAGTGRAGARVELYNSAGSFVTSTTTAAGGTYSFIGLAAGSYTVRVVNSSVSSGRTGYVAGTHLGVQTFRTNASTGSAIAAPDQVGGEVPNKADAGNGSTTLAALTTATTTAQSIAPVTIGAANITDLDFGFNFNLVVNTNNAGQGSLRQFITHANALSNVGLAQQGRTAGIDHAVFMISNGSASPGLRGANNYFTGGVATIAPTSFLPNIVTPMVLDAQTQPGFTASPVIEINGTSAGGAPCFNSVGGSTGSIYRGFIVNRFQREMLYIGAGNVTVQGNWVGLDRTGTLDQGNSTSPGGWAGISVNSAGNTVGGTTALQRNVIAGNEAFGVWVGGNGNTISGNYIGLNAAGTAAVGNGYQGIGLSNASNNTIGGTAAGAGNVISGNSNDGIIISGTSSGNTILGNIIGLNAAGTAAIPNTDDGVDIESDGNNIGDGGVAGRNVISGNGDDGIILDGPDNCVIAGNFIGTNASGSGAVANGGDGIQVSSGAISNTIGGAPAGAGNLISGNSENGIHIDFNSTGTQLLGNLIGVNNAGSSALANGGDGITVRNNSTGTVIGNGTFAGRNLISGNTGLAINFDSGSGSSTVRGNWIGLNASGTGIISSGGGIAIFNSSNHIIGGSAADQGNIIAGTSGVGIQLANAPCAGNVVHGNWIGVLADGTTAAGNTLDGIRIIGGPANNWIGGVNDGEGNIIANNGFLGVRLDTDAGIDNRILRNVITNNGGLGIDLRNNGVSANDALDADGGPNRTQNFPVLFNAQNLGATTRVVGVLNSEASKTYRIEFFNNPAGTEDGTGHGEGRIYMGTANVTTNGSGTADIDETLAYAIANGDRVTATATELVTGSPTNTSEFAMNVVASQPPVAICQNTSVTLGPGGTATITAAMINNGSYDPDGSISSMSVNPSSVSCGQVGNVNVTLTVADNNGIQATCVAVVTVVDATAPTINNCPSNISVNAGAACTAVASWVAPTVSDNCSGASIAQTAGPASGSSFPLGVTTITYTATDGSGNIATCSFTVTVIDVTAPVISGCPSNFTVNAGAACTAVASWVAPTVNDNCSGASIAQTAGSVSGSAFPIGTTTITYTATDGSGNQSTCSFTVTVSDVTAPTINNCPSNIIVNAGAACTAVASWVAPTVNDNCSGSSIAQTAGPASGSAFPIGTTNITYTATDGSGNQSTCSFTVTVNDVTAPTIVSCPSNIIVNAGAACTAVATWVAPTVNDNCSGASIAQTAGPVSGSAFPIGTTTITYTATDGSGNQSTCSFTITVNDVTAPTINCPANVNAFTNTGCTATGVALGSPVTGDNCGVASITNNAPSAFPLGSTTVTWTVTDNAGNTNTCAQTVTVIDNVPPVAICQNITVNLGVGSVSITAAQVNNGSTDNCSIASMSVAPNTFNAVGTYAVVLTVTDGSGNINTCNATVTVTDVNPPVAICQPVTIYLDAAGNASIVAADIDGGSTDNGTIVSMTASQTAFSCSNLGANNVTLTVTDDGGNTDQCMAVVTVVDNSAPTAVCQNITLNLNAGGSASITAAQLDGGSSDNCAVAGLSADQTSFSCSNLGANTVSLTVTDQSGNQSTCNAIVTVVDNILPQITCPANITVNNDLNQCGALVNYVAPVGTDNCAGTITTRIAGLASGSLFPIGITTVTYQVTDASGNSAQCSFTVTVNDNQAPSITCPANITANNDAGQCTAVVNYVAPVGTDNCAGAITSRIAGPASGSAFPLGITTVTYQVTDASGNTTQCSFTVTVNDVTAPTIVSCPANITVNAGAACTAVANWVAPTVSDNCSGASMAQTAGPVSGSAFPLGVTTITYTATDGSGNTSTCSFTVTVVDATIPTIVSCPSNISVNAGAACNAVASWVAPTVSDNCSGASIVQTAGPASGSAFPLGVTTITYTATDGSGNTSTCSFTVTVNDVTAPTIVSCPANITVNAGAACTAVANWVAPTVSDNCSGASMAQTAGPVSGSAFPLGVTTITYTATDGSGNTSTCSFTVTVVDATIPTIVSCPSNISVNAGAACNAVASWVAPTVSDNCSGASIVQTAGPASGSAFPLGVTTITYTATDGSGNTSTCSFTVTVNDVTAPTIVSCPANITVNAGAACTAVANWVAPTVSDNCSGASIAQTAGPASGSAFPLGVTTITYTATDGSGNTSTCSFTVAVVDATNPTIVAPANVAANTNTGCTATGVALGSPVTADNCGVASVTNDAPGAFPLGSTTVTWTVTDNAGNTATATQTVTVTDNVDPVAVCQNITVDLGSGSVSIVAADIDGGSTDNCTIASLSASQTIFNAVGTYNVTLTVTDGAGNTDDCVAVVTVTDTDPPVANCQNVTIYLDASGNASIVAADIDGGSTDNGTIVSLVASQTAFDCGDLGANNVTLTVTDDGGNTDNCVAVVTVHDTIAPTMVCQNIDAYLDASGNVSITGTMLDGGSSDNCGTGSLTFSSSVASFDCSNLGPQTVSLTVTDASGNSSICSAIVTVQDTITPTLACSAASINIDNNGWAIISASAIASWSDNCASGITTWTSTDSVQVVGDTTITVYVQDIAGNIDSCSTTVHVTDTNPPVANCQNVTIYLDANGNASIVAADIDGGSTDNGTIVSLVASQTAFDCNDLGANNVTLTVTDDGGNTDNCMAVVTVLDTIAPGVVCQNINAYLDASGNVTITGTMLDGGSSDNCGTNSLTFSASTASFSCADLGPQTVSLTVTDASGNSSICSATVTVQDTITPTLACSAASINIDNNGWAIISANAIATWSDNCASGITAWVSTDSVQVVGDTTITVYVQDIAGNIDSCSAVVTITDTNPPVANCQNVTIYLDASGNASIVAADIDGGSTDNGTIVSLVASQTAFDCGDLGANNVTLTVTDDGGNTDNCVAVVTVHDTIAPTMVCQNINAYLDASGNVTITGAMLDGGSSDNCGTGSLTFSSSVASFDCSDLGPQTVSLTVTDASGNSSICSATVTVQDTITPTLACSAASINIDNNGWAIISANAIATWSDNCASGITAWVSTDSVQVVGDTTITVYVQDIAGNIDSCSAVVTITDTNPPVANCQNVTIYLDASGNASIVAADIDGGSTDNGTIVSLVASQTAFDCGDLGANNVTLIVTDDGGNTDNCVAIVTVLDTIAPTLTCQPATITLDENGQAVIDPYQLVSASSDNCSGLVLTTDVQVIEHAGNYQVTVIATDASGNSVSCTSSLTVQDSIAPEANCLAFGGLLVYLDVTGHASITPAQLDGGSFDNDTIVSFGASQTLFDCSNIGLNPDTLYVTDASGNTMWCTVGVTVIDTIAPVAACQSITIALDSTGNATIAAADIDGGSMDNCGSLTYSTDITSFDTIGGYTVTLTVTDASGNSSSCSSTVLVIDDTAPEVICHPDTIYLDQSGYASILPADVDGGSTDNELLASLTVSVTTFDCSSIGTNTVALIGTDASGNSAQCETIVTVLDTIAPEATCQNITVQLGSDGQATITAAQINGGSTDNCGSLTYMASVTTFTAAGSYPVTLTVTDGSGNTSSCIATVTVVDGEAPIALCRPATVYLDAAGNASITAADIDGGSTDNGTVTSIVASTTSFNCQSIGANDVVLTVTDDQGNSSSCTAVVTVLDTIAPDVTCQDIELTLVDGQVTIDAIQLSGGCTDNCDSLTYSASITTWSNAGTYEVTLTVSDASGNISSCVATVIVTATDDELVIPSGFSPNGDGIADTWTIHGLPSDARVSTSVFNRWGDEVFSSDDYRSDWDGTCEHGLGGRGPLPDGTYFYNLRINGPNDRTYTGYLQIAR